MKNAKSVKGNFIAKFFSGFVFVISCFITVFSFICIIFLTSFRAFDSSKDAAINSMRDSLYYQVIRNYSSDALNLCLLGDKEVTIFNNTNFRFRIINDNGSIILNNFK